MQLGAYIRRTPHLKLILNTSKLTIEMEIEVKWYIYITVTANCNTETQIEMRDRTVEHFPDVALGHPPELVAVPRGADHFPQVNVHPVVARDQVTVVGLAVFELDQHGVVLGRPQEG